MTEDDFGSYHLRAVNIVGKSGSKLDLIQIPDETTTSITTLTYNRPSLITEDRNKNNKTQLIISKIYKNKSMKNRLNIDSDERFGNGQPTIYSTIKQKDLHNKTQNKGKILIH